MQHNTHSNMQKNDTLQHINLVDLVQVNGGKSLVSIGAGEGPIRAVKPPMYITLAIGEDGGQLPDLLS
jgi:hypothetical protein